MVKNPPAKAGDAGNMGSIPGSGRSSGRRHGNPLQDSCLGNSMDRGAWRATVHGVTKSEMQLSMHAIIEGLVNWVLWWMGLITHSCIISFFLWTGIRNPVFWLSLVVQPWQKFFTSNFYDPFFGCTVLCGMWDLRSPTRDGTHAPTGEAWGPNHWTAREVPLWSFLEDTPFP